MKKVSLSIIALVLGVYSVSSSALIVNLVDDDGDGIPNSIEDYNSDNAEDDYPNDCDWDGIPNSLELDSDNDGIPDSIEAGPDPLNPRNTRGLNVWTRDFCTTDSDNDGIPDAIEAGPFPETPVDTDNDGLPDYRDTDSDNDGLYDHFETEQTSDADADGIPNFRDTDSDNDGVGDALDEDSYVGLKDSDADSIPDAIERGDTTKRLDVDRDGTENYLDTDADGDRIPDSLEAGTDFRTLIDTNLDGLPDYLAIDSDGDGIHDAIEAGDNPSTLPVDTDGDGLPDYRDLDSDNQGLADGVGDSDGDGISDRIEFADNEGRPQFQVSRILSDLTAYHLGTDVDGVPDYLDHDSDHDGISDAIEGTGDIDQDGIPNFRDLDSDGDSTFDLFEAFEDESLGSALEYIDEITFQQCRQCLYTRHPEERSCTVCTNDLFLYKPHSIKLTYNLGSNGMVDVLEASIDSGINRLPLVDADADGIADYLDADSMGSTLSNNSGIADGDTDGNGIHDELEGGNPNQLADYRDWDGDGSGRSDFLTDFSNHRCYGTPDSFPIDRDSDNDGITDVDEGILFRRDINEVCQPVFHRNCDNDNIPNAYDTDSDNDGIPDSIEGLQGFCNDDADNDGIPDFDEAGSNGSVPLDSDSDGVPDFLDLDSDNDGIADRVEKELMNDEDGDGLLRYRDTDSDGDGIEDLIDDDLISELSDADSDGIPDIVEQRNNYRYSDLDRDGKYDYLDIDSDGDGIPDIVEAGPYPLVPIDTDNNGWRDYRDTDSDGDTLYDTSEAGINPNIPNDSDADGLPDYLDLDSDNDGIEDGIDPNYLDSDGDGIPDAIEGPYATLFNIHLDADADGIWNIFDLDSDNDGILDKDEGYTDNDGDGIPNFSDGDSDNDGVFDVYEALGDADFASAAIERTPWKLGIAISNTYEVGSNGIPDFIETYADSGVLKYMLTDTDNDGVADYLDLDSDNDGIPDTWENGVLDVDINGKYDFSKIYTDGEFTSEYRFADTYQGQLDLKSWVDERGIARAWGIAFHDSDSDGIMDFRETDSNNDSVFDIIDAGGTDLNSDGQIDSVMDENQNGFDDFIQNNPLGGVALLYVEETNNIAQEPGALPEIGAAQNSSASSGCSIHSNYNKKDPTLPLLFLFSLIYMFFTQKRVVNKVSAPTEVDAPAS